MAKVCPLLLPVQLITEGSRTKKLSQNITAFYLTDHWFYSVHRTLNTYTVYYVALHGLQENKAHVLLVLTSKPSEITRTRPHQP